MPPGIRVADPRPVEFRYLNLGERLVDYREAWDEQRRIHALVSAGELGPQVLFVEHAPVYTAGRRTLPQERPTDGSEVIEVDRGGKITYHGPGQLVGYPIIFLPWKTGVVDYVRRLEEALILGLIQYGLSAIRIPERTGVWIPGARGAPVLGLPKASRSERKIAAIGIRVSHQTTLHGFALNVTTAIGDFERIIPCGISDAGVTSLAAEMRTEPPDLVTLAHSLEPHLSKCLDLNTAIRLGKR